MASGKDVAELALVPYSEKWGYIWGTSGQKWTEADQKRIERDQAGNKNYTQSIKYGAKWIGRRVADCSGLCKWIARQLSLEIAHGSNSIWKHYCSEKGEIHGEPPVGAFVFKCRNGTDYYHIGVYVGNGEVVEAQGTRTGVVKSSLSTWTHYGLWKDISFDGKAAPEPAVETPYTAVVDVPNDGTLRVRPTPSTSQKEIDVIREGDEVEVIGRSGEWSKIKYVRQAEGYVMTKFLRS